MTADARLRPRSSPTRSARWRWTRSRRRNPAIPACRWAWPRSRSRCGTAICATIRPIRSGPNRDRFVLSNGHGSMLLYALLHLTGYDLPIDELKRFRQLHSKTPGPSGGRRHARRRDHHRPARAGTRQRGRHGARREAARRGVQPARPRDRRSPHLRVPRRRLPDGGHLARGLLARRHAGPGQADRALRRQRHLDRRRVEGLVHRRHAAALRGLRLARDPRRRRPRRRPPSTRAIARGAGASPTGRR